MKTITARVYGAGRAHKQRESFNQSYTYDWSRGEDVRIIEVRNSDITGTNDYTEIIITRPTERECLEELNAQLSDGIFENCRTGAVEIVVDNREHREVSEDANIPQRMFDLPDGTRAFLNPTGYEVWSEEEPIPLYEYVDGEGNLYYTR